MVSCSLEVGKHIDLQKKQAQREHADLVRKDWDTMKNAKDLVRKVKADNERTQFDIIHKKEVTAQKQMYETARA